MDIINKAECNSLKGWSITAIMLHNYCHCFPNSPLENEFTWKVDKTNYFFLSFIDDPIINFFLFLVTTEWLFLFF